MKNNCHSLVSSGRSLGLPGFVGLGCIVAALGCDVQNDVDAIPYAEEISEIEDLDNGSSRSSVLASVELKDGVTVEFVGVSDRTIGIAVGGPVDAALDEAFAAIDNSESPLDAFQKLSSGWKEPSEDFALLSEAVVRAGNWQTRGLRAESLAQRSNTDPQAASADDLGFVAKETKPEAAGCGALWGYGSDLVNQSGGCVLYNRNFYDTTYWRWNDGIAFAGHVITVSGEVRWYVRHSNCAACSWNTDYSKSIPAGYNYVFITYDTNDDFNAESEVITTSLTSQHYHKVVQIHDYRGRTVAGAPGGKAGIVFDNDSKFCTTLNYKGVDPSNIYTSSSWGQEPGYAMCWFI